MNFGDYIVYVDESGDHSLSSIDENFPVFALAFCIFKKSDFTETVVPSIQKLKFEFWGHDAIVLHGHDIRKQHGDFRILIDAKIRASFYEKLNDVIEASPFTVITSVIDKVAHRKKTPSHAIPTKSHWRFVWSDYSIFCAICTSSTKSHM